MSSKSLFNRFIPVYFVASFGLLCFLYGFAAYHFKIFPHKILFPKVRKAERAFKAKMKAVSPAFDPTRATPVAPGTKRITVWKKARAYSGLNFMTLFRNGRFGATLYSMAGEPLHHWDLAFSQAWPKAPHIKKQSPDRRIFMHGAYLYPNGDILVSFDGGNFPYGGGLVKIDRHSRIIWKLPENTHHAIFVDHQQRIWTCAHTHHQSALAKYPGLEPPFYQEWILCLSPEGKVLERISMLQVIYDSGLQGLLLGYSGIQTLHRRPDPLHMNDIELLLPTFSEAFPDFDAGDILVSFREINTIAVIDHTTKHIKWSLTGHSLRQHDPDFLPNGNISIYDNRDDSRGGTLLGGSRLVEIDPVTRKIVWQYSGSPAKPFRAMIQGKQQRLPNGNFLVTNTLEGRVFEIAHDEQKDIVWEFINLIDKESSGMVSQAQRVDTDWIQFPLSVNPDAN